MAPLTRAAPSRLLLLAAAALLLLAQAPAASAVKSHVIVTGGDGNTYFVTQTPQPTTAMASQAALQAQPFVSSASFGLLADSLLRAVGTTLGSTPFPGLPMYLYSPQFMHKDDGVGYFAYFYLTFEDGNVVSQDHGRQWTDTTPYYWALAHKVAATLQAYTYVTEGAASVSVPAASGLLRESERVSSALGVDSSALVVQIFTEADMQGSVALGASGAFEYTCPAGGCTGTATFAYIVTNGNPGVPAVYGTAQIGGLTSPHACMQPCAHTYACLHPQTCT